MGFLEEDGLRGLGEEVWRGVCARCTWWNGRRACVRPGTTEGSFTHCLWWGLFSTLVKYHYITLFQLQEIQWVPDTAAATPWDPMQTHPPLLSHGGWRRVKEKPIHSILLWGLRGWGWILWAVRQWAAFWVGPWLDMSGAHTPDYYFLSFLRNHYLNSHFSVSETTKVGIPALLTVRPWQVPHTCWASDSSPVKWVW